MYGGKPVVKRVLVVCPGSLVKNWEKEFKKWLGNERLPVYAVGNEKRVEQFVPTKMNAVRWNFLPWLLCSLALVCPLPSFDSFLPFPRC